MVSRDWPADGRLDAANARGDGALGLDAENAGLGSVVEVGAAAELDGEVAHLHHADRLTVLLAEQGDGAALLGLLNRAEPRSRSASAREDLRR